MTDINQVFLTHTYSHIGELKSLRQQAVTPSVGVVIDILIKHLELEVSALQHEEGYTHPEGEKTCP